MGQPMPPLSDNQLSQCIVCPPGQAKHCSDSSAREKQTPDMTGGGGVLDYVENGRKTESTPRGREGGRERASERAAPAPTEPKEAISHKNTPSPPAALANTRLLIALSEEIYVSSRARTGCSTSTAIYYSCPGGRDMSPPFESPSSLHLLFLKELLRPADSRSSSAVSIPPRPFPPLPLQPRPGRRHPVEERNAGGPVPRKRAARNPTAPGQTPGQPNRPSRRPAACPRSAGNVTQLETAVDRAVIATGERGRERAKMHNRLCLSRFAGTRRASAEPFLSHAPPSPDKAHAKIVLASAARRRDLQHPRHPCLEKQAPLEKPIPPRSGEPTDRFADGGRIALE
ncbi:hypothetical protein SKAU_G00198930 [Synaphobranchus kaupii]|uniref:Uncharacterized protein n=1 Tax=Synaphobranchus kaupii TaxID=118154 RepID=A0A9Q1IX38_SYNKA|nr:hypothetical protein SKAU_G00198930 [Synaphobranchus kaupii]